MKKWMRFNPFKGLGVLLVLWSIIVTPAQTQTLSNLTIYVWDFSTREGRTTDITTNLTKEFEEALIQCRRFQILERRRYDRLLAQKDNEKAILKMEGISLSTLNNLKTIQANAVIFGEVYDDIENGSIKVTIICQTFDGRILFQQSSSFLRGLRFHAPSREAAMQEIVNNLPKDSNAIPPLPKDKRTSPKPSETDTNQQHIKQFNKSANLVVNGSFTVQYEGWERKIGDITQGASKTDIIPFQHGKSGKALHIKHEGTGSIQFIQVVEVPSADLVFSASFQASTHEGMIIGFTGTGIVQIALQYIDTYDHILGQTILFNYVKNPFADTPLLGVPRRKSDSYKEHFITFNKGQFYQNHRLDVRREIEDNLLGIDANSLRKIVIVIWCGATHRQAGSELWITDISLMVK